MDSAWLDRPIAIDGLDDEWEGLKVYLKKANVDLGAANDSHSLILCATTVDPTIQIQVVRQGLEVWFDPDGGNDREYGIRFPSGMQRAGMRGMMQHGGGGMRRPDPEQLAALFDEAMLNSEMELMSRGDKEGQRVALADLTGFEARISYDRGRMVYELKVPLRRGSNRHGIPVSKQSVGIGFATPRFDFEQFRERRRGMRGGGMPGGGIGGGQGGGFGGRGGGRGGGGFGVARGGGGFVEGRPEPVEFWLKVALAQPPES